MQNDSIDNLRLDINKEKVRAIVYVRQGDVKSKTLHITLADHGHVVSLQNVVIAEIFIAKTDGTECDQGMIVYGDELHYTLRSNDIASLGENIAQVQLTYSDGTIVTSPEFSIMVYEKKVSQKYLQSTNEYTALTQSVANASQYASNAKASETSAKASEVSIEGYVEEVNILKEEIAVIKEEAESASDVVKAYGIDAKESKDRAKLSEDNAKASELNASTSEANAKASEDNAKASEENAKVSETNAKVSETNAKASETSAKASETNAKTSETKADNYQKLAKRYLDEMGQGQLTLGETADTAYRGDHGKVAYDHTFATSNPHSVTYTQVGADKNGAAAEAYTQATGYVDQKIADLINGAPETLDTLKEIADAMATQQEVVDALNQAIGTKANEVEYQAHSSNETIHITATERTKWDDVVALRTELTELQSKIGYPL